MVATGSQLPAPVGHRPRRTVRRVVGAAAGAIALLGLLTGCSIEEAFSFGWPTGRHHATERADVRPLDRVGDRRAGSRRLRLGPDLLVHHPLPQARRRAAAADPVQPADRADLHGRAVPRSSRCSSTTRRSCRPTSTGSRRPRGDGRRSQPCKWNWKFDYPDTLGSNNQPVSTVGSSDYIPVLVLPTNKRIRFVEHSPDVIHSFWVPELLFKRDVFPGNVVQPVRGHDPDPEGAYVGRCAELCGTYHSMMNFELRAVSPETVRPVPRREAAGHEYARGAERDRGGAVRHHDGARSRPSATPTRSN